MYEGVPFPKDMCSYIEQLKKDLAYEAGSKAQLRDREFFEKLIRQSEPIYNGIDGTAKLDAARELMHDNKLRSAFNASDDVTSALDIFHLEAEPTKRLMDFARNIIFRLLVCFSWESGRFSRRKTASMMSP